MRMTTFLIATRNAHKVMEIKSILGPQFHFLTLADVPGSPHIVEDAPDFAGNAQKKSIGLAKWLAASAVPAPSGDFFVLADDSGLEVDTLNGAPGVHSARFAALDRTERSPGSAPQNSSDAENNAKILRLLNGVPFAKCSARFRCVIALTPVISRSRKNHSPVCGSEEMELRTELFDGVCEGRISRTPAGAGGFGYDPLFVPEGFEQSFAQLGEDVKNRISHRSRALAKLKKRFLLMSGFIPV